MLQLRINVKSITFRRDTRLIPAPKFPLFSRYDQHLPLNKRRLFRTLSRYMSQSRLIYTILSMYNVSNILYSIKGGSVRGGCEANQSIIASKVISRVDRPILPALSTTLFANLDRVQEA